MILSDDDRARMRLQLSQSHQTRRETEPEPVVSQIDLRPGLAAVAEAIRAAAMDDTDDRLRDAIVGVAKAIKGQSLKPLAEAISSIKFSVPADYLAAVADIVKAIDANTAVLKSVARSMTLSDQQKETQEA